jgi:amidohydrolase
MERVALVSSELEAQAVAWRRHLHAHPELSFEEIETSAFVADTLAAFGGLELDRPTPTSVVARLRGAQPGRTIALRADMDALPIQEETRLEFASTRPGVMHACGHDGHTAMLLASARLLTERRQELSGEVRFVFQHAEEKPPGGARELVAAGAMDGVDLVVGAHLISRLDVGKVGIGAGPRMACGDTFAIEVIGSAGHAAFPHTSVDPVAVAAELVANLQHVVSRQTNPLDSVVVSVTRIHGGTADNVIPESVELGGTVRAFTLESRDRTRSAMERMVSGVTEAHGATGRLDYLEGYAPVVNDEAATALVQEAAVAELGADAVVEQEPIMAGEDFSAYQQVVPGTFFVVGARNESIGASYPHHHSRFAIDESALRNGIAVLTRAALDLLEAPSKMSA